MPGPLLALRRVAKSFEAMRALDPIDFEVQRDDVCAILGPSGCGKSTLLRIVAGVLPSSAGRVLIEGADVTALPPETRPTNLVSRGCGLLPHMTVAQNVAFGLALRHLPRLEIAARVDGALRLRLDGLASRPVPALSGGQQQRVALARCWCCAPRCCKVLLLEEPLSALDLKLRGQMQDAFRRIYREVGGTFLFVTHTRCHAPAAGLGGLFSVGSNALTGVPMGGLTLGWRRGLWTGAGFRAALWTSLGAAGAGALLATLTGTLAAQGLARASPCAAALALAVFRFRSCSRPSWSPSPSWSLSCAASLPLGLPVAVLGHVLVTQPFMISIVRPASPASTSPPWRPRATSGPRRSRPSAW